jgi:peptidoglycan/LPS O-acetylase OafA/YrhL
MSANPHPAYRPDIDGLRAIAVLAVIAFHASARIVPGGFIGVDVFFVISGFLISSLIIRGMESGTFSFAGFYLRRIKRILPAYIVVALATLVISSFLLIPNDYIFYTTSLAASWGFAANVFFSMLSWGYFGQRTEEFPLLHTWSLSVEEQFYFAFPILLLFLFRYFRKHVVAALCVLAVVFLAISQLKTGQVKSYFLLTSRAHELLIGALTFYLARRHPPASRAMASVLAIAGMALMLGSLFLINSGTPFPGINSLYPCIGTAMLIYAGCADNALSPLLKSRPMVFIGLISYSLYLWHWPIFSFLRYRRIEIDFTVGTLAVAAALLLAWLTWKFIESPIRANRKITFKSALLRYYALPCAAFMSVGLYSYVTEGAPLRFPEETRQLISSYSFERDLSRTCSIRPDDYRKVTYDYLAENCAFGDLNQKQPQVLLMGDSHADHFKPFVNQLAKNAGLKSVFHVQGGCLPIYLPGSGLPAPAVLGVVPPSCEQRNADLLDQAGRYKYVVLAGFWSSEYDDNFGKRLDTVVDRIVKTGATPILFKDNPSQEEDLSRCILYKKRGWIAADRNCNIPYGPAAQRQAPPDSVIDQVKQKYPRTIVVDPKRVMCSDKECATYIANIALYKDANHINAKAAALLADRYIAAVGNPLSIPQASDALGTRPAPQPGQKVEVRAEVSQRQGVAAR